MTTLLNESEIHKIKLTDIAIKDGYNVRLDYGNVDEIAKDIKVNGIKGMERLWLRQESDGTLILVRGHRRFFAFQLAKKNGIPIEEVECVICPKEWTEEDYEMDLYRSNLHAKNLTRMEKAVLVDRRIKAGWTPKKIAKKMQITQTEVSLLQTLISAPEEIVDHIVAEKLSATLALEIYHKEQSDWNKAWALLKEKLEKGVSVTKADFSQYFKSKIDADAAEAEAVEAETAKAEAAKAEAAKAEAAKAEAAKAEAAKAEAAKAKAAKIHEAAKAEAAKAEAAKAEADKAANDDPTNEVKAEAAKAEAAKAEAAKAEAAKAEAAKTEADEIAVKQAELYAKNLKTLADFRKKSANSRSSSGPIDKRIPTVTIEELSELLHIRHLANQIVSDTVLMINRVESLLPETEQSGLIGMLTRCAEFQSKSKDSQRIESFAAIPPYVEKSIVNQIHKEVDAKKAVLQAASENQTPI